MSYRFNFLPEPPNPSKESETQLEDSSEIFNTEYADNEYENEFGGQPRRRIPVRQIPPAVFRPRQLPLRVPRYTFSSKTPRYFYRPVFRPFSRAFPTRTFPPIRPRFPRVFPFPVRPLIESVSLVPADITPTAQGGSNTSMPTSDGSAPIASGNGSTPMTLSGGDNLAPTARDNSEYIRWVQSTLNQILNLNLPVDGVMSVETRSAVRSFQKQKSLPVDGIVGPETEKALIESRSAQPPQSTGTTSPSDSEADFGLYEFEEGLFASDYESSAGNACSTFTPTAVESPGGGRIKDKRIPNKSDLVFVKGAFSDKVPLHRLAAEALNALVCAARADGIKHPILLPTGGGSGFRDPKRQSEAWQRALKKYGSEEVARKWVAKPGSSAHQTGRAIDFYLGDSNDSRNVTKLRKTSAYKWLVANAHRFGFYPYKNEPWHWEYNPPAQGQSELFSEMDHFFEFEDEIGYENESFNYEDEFDNQEYETKKSCKRDWCDQNYIRWVQRSLNQILGLQLKEDGGLGRLTRSAIRRFQQRNGLKADSSIGPATEKALIAAGAINPPEIKQMPCGPTDSKELIKLLNKYRGDIPLHFLLGWIEVESGRRIDSLTKICERGYFQIHPEEAQDHGIKNHQDISYNSDYSVQAGIHIVKLYVDRAKALADKFAVSKQSDLFWGLVKLHHWIPSGPLKILKDMQEHGFKPVSWTAFKQYVVSEENRKRLFKLLKGYDPADGINNADKTLNEANKWLRKLGAAPNGNLGLTASPTTPITSTSGLDIVNVRGIKVARQIAQQVQALLAAAEADGIKLGGGGYRSSQQQVKLRKKHCGTSHYDIYEKPSSQCSPPTATPGHSQHEKGLAIDFTHNGKTIHSRSSPAFQWLAKNAARFGLYNLPSEPWHWSVNGR